MKATYNWDTGKKTIMREENGVYVLELWIQIPVPKEDNPWTQVPVQKGGNPVDNLAKPLKAGFARQARPLI